MATTLSVKAIRAVVLCLPVLAMLSPSVLARDNSAFIRQIAEAENTPVAQERQVMTFSTPGAGSINAIDAGLMDNLELGLPGEGRRVSAVIQRGSRNRAVVNVQGGNNATLQYQAGVALDSEIRVLGVSNAVAVDQRGVGLESDIGVMGANKRIIHIQRGHGASIESAPLQYTGVGHEAEVVLDTPRGRLTKTLPR